MEPLELAIQNHLHAYLGGRLSLDQFTDWFVGATWDIDRVTSPNAYELAATIELALAEASSGLLTDEELRNELIKLVADVRVGARLGA